MLLKEKEDDPWNRGLHDFGHMRMQKNAYRDNYAQKYRTYNDGHGFFIEDNWPMRVEYRHYKAWADQIKDKAMGTLKFTVSRLINDFENSEETENQVVEFDDVDKETKQQALRRLLKLINQETGTDPSLKKEQKRRLMSG